MAGLVKHCSKLSVIKRRGITLLQFPKEFLSGLYKKSVWEIPNSRELLVSVLLSFNIGQFISST